MNNPKNLNFKTGDLVEWKKDYSSITSVCNFDKNIGIVIKIKIVEDPQHGHYLKIFWLNCNSKTCGKICTSNTRHIDLVKHV